MNNLNFDDLVNMLEHLKKEKGEECLICQLPITDNTSIKLICNHYYHEKCLIIKNKFISCPYCNQVTLKKDKEKQKNICQVILKGGKNKGKVCNRNNCKIHKNLNVFKEKEQKLEFSNECKIILKTGINKGKVCNRINCKYHKPISLDINF